MFQAEFEPVIPASERQQTHALDRTVNIYLAKYGQLNLSNVVLFEGDKRNIEKCSANL
jgi:hypothetical protein